MFRAARRPVATLAMLIVLEPFIAGCVATQHVPFHGTKGIDRISGVTTRSGTEVPFAQPGAVISNDTLYAAGRHGQVILPTDSIAVVWDRKVAVGRSVALTAGVALVGVLIAGAVAFGNSNMFGTP
jgi:hypothetical protein